ncbi:MAG: hypothetical protein N5P05_000142 [Chroococcopsis gigantea SAG 12.99]|jgi:DNA uptake protein ComE-like DNA-binding protein|nr:ComEA family DNA-binding protein [Chlorogloea purpurea SAG 13.99]MDV2998536.1 hypothetical protein [Chroococcopsis gigantea SAG 12.99]
MFANKKANLRQKILNDPYYRFQSGEEIAIAAQLGIKINVASASVDDWLRLPGISIHQAKQLVALVGMGVELLCVEDISAALSLPGDRFTPFRAVLEFCYYHEESALAPPKINPNNATPEQLNSIPGMSSSLIQGLIDERDKKGYYRHIIDLQQRLNLTGQQINQFIHYLQF